MVSKMYSSFDESPSTFVEKQALKRHNFSQKLALSIFEKNSSAVGNLQCWDFIDWFKFFGSPQIPSLPFGFLTITKGFIHLVSSLTGHTISGLCTISNSLFSWSSIAIRVFLAGVITAVMFWSIVMRRAFQSVRISPKQLVCLQGFTLQKFLFSELEMDGFLSIRFNCLLEFGPLMRRKFVSTTLNNSDMFLPWRWISKVHCPFSDILLQLYVLRVVVGVVILGFVCRVLIWFSGISLIWAPVSVL